MRNPVLLKNKFNYYKNSFLRHDLKSSITLLFVALPLCLGIALASGVPVYTGLIAGIVGGIVVSFISNSSLGVSGPAAGLVTICASAILELGSIDLLAIAIVIAGVLQLILGFFKLAGFSHFIPSPVIKGMLAAIGILLMTKQIPIIIGYNKPDFWSAELFNIFTFNHGFQHIKNLYQTSSFGVTIISVITVFILFILHNLTYQWSKNVPSAFVSVICGVLMAWLLNVFAPTLSLKSDHFIQLPQNIFSNIRLPDWHVMIQWSAQSALIWKTGVIICIVASLESLLSTIAIDKLDPFNRITNQNRELIAQGVGNTLSGLLGGLPITAVIVRGSANLEAGARSKLSAILHGIWLLLALLFALAFINKIPYGVLAVILIRTGYNLAKPAMFKDVYHQGKEQFLPFIVTIIAILFSDLLIGVLIGFIYAIYFMMKNQYKAGFIAIETPWNHTRKFELKFDQHVSFLNKRKLTEYLDKIPDYSMVELNGSQTSYFDRDILEIIQDYKSKAFRKHIELKLIEIPEVKTIGLH